MENTNTSTANFKNFVKDVIQEVEIQHQEKTGQEKKDIAVAAISVGYDLIDSYVKAPAIVDNIVKSKVIPFVVDFTVAIFNVTQKFQHKEEVVK